MAFFGGSTGVIYRQFSLTIVSAMALSVLVALILTPALAATILKPGDPLKHEGNGPLARFFRWFNDRFDRARVVHESGVRKTHRRQAALGARLCASSSPSWPFSSGACRPASCPTRTPARSSPWSPSPSGATLPADRRGARLRAQLFRQERGQECRGRVHGRRLLLRRPGPECRHRLRPAEAVGRAQAARRTRPRPSPTARSALCPRYRDALIISFIPPAALELGNATGFDLQLVDTGNIGHAKLVEARNMLLGMAMQDKRIVGVRPVSLEDAPQLNVDVDQDKARALGLDIGQINQTISSRLGRLLRQRLHRPRPRQARLRPGRRALSPAARGHFRPLRPRRRRQEHGAVHRFLDAQMGQRAGPAVALQRPAVARASGFAGAGRQHRHGDEGDGGDAGQAAARHRASNGPACRYEEQQSSGQAPLLYGLSLLIVFLCLAALYESWTIPLAVLLVVPLGIVGAVLDRQADRRSTTTSICRSA